MKYILLHGLGQTSLSWNQTVKAMGHQSDVLCPDIFDWLHDGEVSYASLYQAFSEYCLGFSEPLSICGLSLGGVLALQYGLEYPDKVSSMVLLGTQFIMPKRLLKFQNMIFCIMPNKAFQNMNFSKKAVISLSKSMMDIDFQQNLKDLTCPVLVICGERDSANRKASIQMGEQIPHAEVVMVENSGHEVNIDNPEKLGQLLTDFLK